MMDNGEIPLRNLPVDRCFRFSSRVGQLQGEVQLDEGTLQILKWNTNAVPKR